MSRNGTAPERDLSEVGEFWREHLSDINWGYYNNLGVRDKKFIEMLANEKVIETVKKYDHDAAEDVADAFCYVARSYGNKKRVVKMSEVLGLKEVVDTLNRCAVDIGNVSCRDHIFSGVYYSLAIIAGELNDKNAVIETAKTIRKYKDDEKVAPYIAEDLAHISAYLNVGAFIELNKIIRRYGGKNAEIVTRALYDIVPYFNNSKMIPRFIKVLNNLGKTLFDVMDADEVLEMMEKDLDRLVEDSKSFDAVARYIKSEGRLPKPTRKNIGDYSRAVGNYIKKKYRIKKDIDMNKVDMLMDMLTRLDTSIISYKKMFREAVRHINSSEERNAKYYSIGIKDNCCLDYDKDTLKQYSIISIVGSKDREKEKRAIDAISGIVGQKIVNRARNDFRSRHKHLLRDIVSSFQQTDYDRACDILKQTGSESIVNVLKAVGYREGKGGDTAIIKAVESKNPLDYDSRVQMACVYLPQCYSILDYCRDSRFVLVRYDIGDKALGSAICYMEGENFLVDSVEGHRRFRKDKIYETVFNDLVERAKERNAKLILFNSDVANLTAKGFVRYLGKKNLAKKNVPMRLATGGMLESRIDANKYVIELQNKAGAAKIGTL
jgi:hypothetical protein